MYKICVKKARADRQISHVVFTKDGILIVLVVIRLLLLLLVILQRSLVIRLLLLLLLLTGLLLLVILQRSLVIWLLTGLLLLVVLRRSLVADGWLLLLFLLEPATTRLQLNDAQFALLQLALGASQLALQHLHKRTPA